MILSKVVNNITRSHSNHYCAWIIIFITTITIYYFINDNLLRLKQEKEESFIIGCQQSINNLLINDFKLILDQTEDLNKLTILKNYYKISINNGIAVGNKLNLTNYIMMSNILYIYKGLDVFVFDLQPLFVLINSILEKDFYYQIALNSSILTTNVENLSFNYEKTHQINDGNYISIKLIPKADSKNIMLYTIQFEKQKATLLYSLCVFLLSAIAVAVYILRKSELLKLLKRRISNISKACTLNSKYIKSCYSKHYEQSIPVILNVATSDNNNNVLDIANIMDDIEVYALSYTSMFFYKIELNMVSDVSYINFDHDQIIFKQIIISLVHNILYFMRGGSHVKKCYINFREDQLSIVYDSFAANESHMMIWSKDIFLNTGNPYILDCSQIFQLLKIYNLDYEVLPKQGENSVIIYFNNKNNGKKEDFSNVIQFAKHI